MVVKAQSSSSTHVDENLQQITSELDHARRSLKEITLMVEQSQLEMSKLSQRNALANGNLQQVQAQIETMPRADIRQVYESAMDTQQRLLVMRGQLEKLQSDQQHLQKIVSYLETATHYLSDNRVGLEGKTGASGTTVIEMVINAQEQERQRLSRQMHDGPAQALSNFIVQAEIAARMFDVDPQKAKDELSALKAAAMNTFQKVRVFIFELRPMMLDDLGLFPTIRRYIESFRTQTGVDVVLSVRGQERRIEPYLEVMIFRSLQEIMWNAAKFNQDNATKIQIQVQIAIEDDLINISVNDNGKGFDPAVDLLKGGLGLKFIRERVEMLGGEISIDAAIDQGAQISFQVPCLGMTTS
jgi:two-component system, NarL family, sensor histidine kinase DegS